LDSRCRYTVDGFLAHEVQEIVPEAVTGTKDAVDADIESLTARVSALEGN
jgi:hypothetical protein